MESQLEVMRPQHQQKAPSLMAKVASRFNVDPTKMMHTLKQTAFKQNDRSVTDEQLMALLIVADQYGLNPFTKELYAYPDKSNGVVPVVSIDGWSRIINSHPQMDGLEFAFSPDMVCIKGAKPCPEWIEAIIYRKDRSQPIRVREYLDETYRDSQRQGPWQTHTKRMLRHKATIQCARMAFGFAGIYDEDEAKRIVEVEATPAAKPEQSHRSSVAQLRGRVLEQDHAEQAVTESATESDDMGVDVEPIPYFDPELARDDLISLIGEATTKDELKKVSELPVYQQLKADYPDLFAEVNKASAAALQRIQK